MTIYFGLELDERVIRPDNIKRHGIHFFGLKKLLAFFESKTGLLHTLPENDYLRTEQFRQVLSKHIELNPNPHFYAASFTSDQLSTARTMLQLRDELKLNGYDFNENTKLPPRLNTFSQLEQLATDQLDPGFSDRWLGCMNQIEHLDLGISHFFYIEPKELLPSFVQNCFSKLQKIGIQVEQWSTEKVGSSKKDVHIFQQSLLGLKTVSSFEKDGSLIILKSKRESKLAKFIAQLLPSNPNFRPTCIIPDKNRALDNAFVQEGLPSLGILSASLGRPSLQILKLVTTFLWHPIDPIKVLEFVSLALKPIDDGLAAVIARELASKPGIGGDNWARSIAIFFDELKEKAIADQSIDVNKARFDYEFWFKRKRYHVNSKVPKEEVRQVFEQVRTWSYKLFEDANDKNTSILVLSEQAKRMLELLDAIPEKDLSYLELERIVRAIYEPAPVQFQKAEIGHLPYVHQNTALLDSPDQVLWWNFSEKEPDYFFSNWYQNEIKYLQSKKIYVFQPKDKNVLMTWQRMFPIFRAQKQLILAHTDYVHGEKVLPHPLLGNLKAQFSNLDDITFDIDKPEGIKGLQAYFNIPEKESLEQLSDQNQTPFIAISQDHSLSKREKESYSSLDDLFYYPYKWVFRHQLSLHKSSILSVVNEKTLLGNLSHRFFELLLKEDNRQLSNQAVYQWIDQNKDRILSEEGTPLLMYGKEPQRINFINRLKYAAVQLIRHINDNDWKVIGTEVVLEGTFMGIPIKGIADLVLERGNERAIVDLKWSGRSRRASLIKSEEDLQLTLYAKLIEPQSEWAHTAYFILDEGVLIARNNAAFKQALTIAPDQDIKETYQRIWTKMQATFEWRMQQMEQGQIEVRTKESSDELEEMYGEILLKVLEMKSEDAFFDDYKTLVNRFD